MCLIHTQVSFVYSLRCLGTFIWDIVLKCWWPLAVCSHYEQGCEWKLHTHHWVEWSKKKKNPFIVEFLELLSVTLFGKSVFADTAKLSIFRRDQTRLSSDAKSNHKYPYKSNTEGDDRHGKRKGLCGCSGRDWSHDTVIIQGMSGFTKAGRRKTVCSSHWRARGPAQSGTCNSKTIKE